MSVLFVNPIPSWKIIYPYDAFPLYAATLSAPLIQSNIKCGFLDQYLFDDKQQFYSALEKLIPDFDIFALCVYTSYLPESIHISKLIKNTPNKRVVWGGPHPTLLPTQTANAVFVDNVVVGYGEFVLLDIAQNKVFDGKILKDEQRRDISIFEPNYDIFDIDKYFDIFEKTKRNDQEKRTMTLLTSRGCPYSCSFCINSIARNKPFLYPLEYVKSGIEFCVKNSVRRIFFVDENFYYSQERFVSIANMLAGLNIVWEANIRADVVAKMDDGLLKFAKKSGLTRLRFGGESASDRMLKILKKGITVSDTITACFKCIKNDITPNTSWMTGLFEETQEEAASTRFLCKMLNDAGVEISGPQKYRPYPMSEETNKFINAGILSMPERLEDWEQSDIFKRMVFYSNDQLQMF